MSPFIRPAAIRYADRLLATSVFCIMLVIYSATMSTQPDIMDGEVEFQSTSSLVRKRSLALGGTPEGDAIANLKFNCRSGAGEREHQAFSWFGVGQAMTGVPFYMLGSGLSQLFPEIEEDNAKSTHMGFGRSEYFPHLLVGWRNSILGALTCVLIVLSSRRLGSSRRSAWIAGMTYGLCSFAWPQARSTFNSVQATFFLLLACHGLLVLVEAYNRYRSPKRSSLLFAGLGLGMAFLTRSVLSIALLVLGLGFVWSLLRAKRQKIEQASWAHLGWVLLPALLCFAFFLVTNQLRFGSLLESGYGDAVTLDKFFGYPPQKGLAGLLISPSRGLLWMAPGLLLAIPMLWRRIQRGELRLPLMVLGLAAAILLPPALTVGWHGAEGYGPRYALPLLPLLWLGVGPSLDLIQKRSLGVWTSVALMSLGFLTSLAGVLVDTSTHSDLAHQAALLRFPEMPGPTEADRNAARFERMQWDLDFAAPWAHWRILRHRAAGLPEAFPAGAIFNLKAPHAEQLLIPAHDREKGFQHLAWADFKTRLNGALWPLLLLGLACMIYAAVSLVRGFDPDRA